MKPTHVKVRGATIQDADALISHQQAMAWETGGLELNPEVVHSGVCSVFESNDKGFYLVAEVDEEVVGSLLVTYVGDVRMERLARRNVLEDTKCLCDTIASETRGLQSHVLLGEVQSGSRG